MWFKKVLKRGLLLVLLGIIYNHFVNIVKLIFDKDDGRSVLLKDAIDSIFAPMEKLYEGRFSGNMLELGVRVCSLINDEIVCSDVKWTGNRELEFYKNDGTVIHLQ